MSKTVNFPEGASEVAVAQAYKLASQMDQKRTKLMESLLGKALEPTLFDVTFNCQTLKKEEVVQAILALMQCRKMI